MGLVMSFVNVECGDVAVAGGKGANLSLMTRAGLPVPPGFVVATAAYREFVSGTGIADQVFRIIDALDHRDAPALEAASQRNAARMPSMFPEVPIDAAG